MDTTTICKNRRCNSPVRPHVDNRPAPVYCSRRCRSREKGYEYRDRHPGYYQEGNLRRLERKFGISYDEEYDKQGGRCAICLGLDAHNAHGGRFSIDHDHDTGEYRGLLCALCNTGLGKLGDNKEGLLRALNYLENGFTPALEGN